MQRRTKSLPRRLARLVGAAFTLIGLLGVLATFASASTPASARTQAQTGQDQASNQVRIVEVSGLLDPVMHDFLLRELDRAEADGVLGVLLQYNSRGSVLNQEDFVELATRLEASPVQVGIWVGPSGSAALGGAAELLGVADFVGVSVGSRVGETGPLRLPPSTFGQPFGDATERLETASVAAPDALDLGVTTVLPDPACETMECKLTDISVLREFLTYFDGYQSPAETDEASELTEPRFVQLPISGQLFHTVASPEVAYLLFVGGLALLVFELYTAGVGIAGVIGAFCLVMGCYGLAALPARNLAIALLIGSMLAFAVDIQTNMPRLYSALGMLLFMVGSWFLYDGLRVSWVTLIVGIVGAALYAYTGMPSMVRTRFSSPTIGRSWMIGELGRATSDLAPEGSVIIRDAPWRAFTNRATPLKQGDQIKVVGIHRMLLEVAPLEGAARDYRERARSGEPSIEADIANSAPDADRV